MITTIHTIGGKSILFDQHASLCFGPIFDDDNEANQFLEWLHKLRLEATDLSASGLKLMMVKFREGERPAVLERKAVSSGKAFEAVL